MHWTYEKYKDDDDLRQGDIIEPDETLLALFKKIHQHFAQEKYRGYLITSQTCDLVRRKDRGGHCSATHISLSVIRSIQDIISVSLKNQFGYLAPGIYNKGMKRSVELLANRLINQNENALGLFYLHPEYDAGIAFDSVAVLRVSISIKAPEHYDKLMKARVGRLSKEFQPKLGWMVGNLYSRVGVPDWDEKSTEESNEEEVLKRILSFHRNETIWLEKKIYKKILREIPKFEDLPHSEQEAIIEKKLPPPPKERILEIISETVSSVVPQICSKQLGIIKKNLSNNETFEAQMRKFGRS